MQDLTLIQDLANYYAGNIPAESMSGIFPKISDALRRLEEMQKTARDIRFKAIFPKLREFHAAVLACGTIPTGLVREELWARLGVE